MYEVMKRDRLLLFEMSGGEDRFLDTFHDAYKMNHQTNMVQAELIGGKQYGFPSENYLREEIMQRTLHYFAEHLLFDETIYHERFPSAELESFRINALEHANDVVENGYEDDRVVLAREWFFMMMFPDHNEVAHETNFVVRLRNQLLSDLDLFFEREKIALLRSDFDIRFNPQKEVW